MPLILGLSARLTFGTSGWPAGQKSQWVRIGPRSPKSGAFYHKSLSHSGHPHEHETSDWAPTRIHAFSVSAISVCQLWCFRSCDQQAPATLPFSFSPRRLPVNVKSGFVKRYQEVLRGACGWLILLNPGRPLTK